MRAHYDEGTAYHIGPEPCVSDREVRGKASVGDRKREKGVGTLIPLCRCSLSQKRPSDQGKAAERVGPLAGEEQDIDYLARHGRRLQFPKTYKTAMSEAGVKSVASATTERPRRC